MATLVQEEIPQKIRDLNIHLAICDRLSDPCIALAQYLNFPKVIYWHAAPQRATYAGILESKTSYISGVANFAPQMSFS